MTRTVAAAGAPAVSSARLLTEQAFDRAAGAPLVEGNAVRLLKDGPENYPAWLAALEAARERIHLEVYILADDTIGRRFAEVLARKARAGVRVRLVYDWLGALGKAGTALLAGAARGRCRGALLQPAAARLAGRRAAQKPSQVDRGGRRRRLRHRAVRRRPLVRRPGARRRALARHGHRAARPRGARRRPGLRRHLGRDRPAAARGASCRSSPAARAGDVALRVVAGTSFSTATFRIDARGGGARAAAAVAGRRLLRGHRDLRAGAARGGPGRGRRPAAGAGGGHRHRRSCRCCRAPGTGRCSRRA